MSKDNVSGIVLDIPKEVLDNIKDADKYIKQLEATSRQAAQKIKGHFDNTMVSGVKAFIKKVNEAQTKLGSVKMPTIDATGLSAAIQELSKAMSTIDKSATTGSRRLEKIADAITKLETAKPAPATFKAIADGITEIGRTSDGTIDKIRSLSDMMAKLARDIRTVESARAKMSADTATAAQYNKLYKEQAQIVRELNTLNSKPSKTPEEIALLNRLQDRYVEIGKAIDDLNKKKQTAASKLAREQGKLRAELTTNISDPVGAISYAKQAKSLNELQAAYKNLKAVMATTKPDSSAWQQMNAVLGQTRTRIDEIKKKMGEFKSTASGVGDIAGQLKRSMAAVFSVSAITGYINKMVVVRAEFELQQTALRAILQNKDEADRIFMQVQQMALQSPFSILQLTTYTKQLAAYRIESEKLVGTTKMLADVSAGLGVDIGRLILAYGQVKAANYLRATEVRQFTEAGLNIAGELANYFSELQGKMISVGDVMDMITKRMVRFEDVEEVFKRVTSAGGLFYDMQRKQSETLKGQLQRINDAMSIMFNEIGKDNEGVIISVVKGIRELLKHWRTVAKIIETVVISFGAYKAVVLLAHFANSSFGKSLAKAQLGLINQRGALRGNVATLGLYATAINTVKNALRGLATATVPAALIAGLSYLIVKFIDAREKAKAFKQALEDIDKDVSKEADAAVNTYTRLASKVADVTTSYEERKEALEELNRTYGNILPKQALEYDGIVNMTDGYKNATNAIREYYEEQRRQKRIDFQTTELEKTVEELSKAIDIENILPGATTAKVRELLSKAIKDSVSDGLNSTKDVLLRFFENLADYYNQGADLPNFVTNAVRRAIPESNWGFTDIQEAIDKQKMLNDEMELAGLIANASTKEEEDALREQQKTIMARKADWEKLKESIRNVQTALQNLRQLQKGGKLLDNLTDENGKLTESGKAVNALRIAYGNLGIEQSKIPATLEEIRPLLLTNQSIADEAYRVGGLAMDNFVVKLQSMPQYFDDANLHYIGFTESIKKEADSMKFNEVQQDIIDVRDKVLQLNGLDLSAFGNIMVSTKSTISSVKKDIQSEIADLTQKMTNYTNALAAGATVAEAQFRSGMAGTLAETQQMVDALTQWYLLLGGDDKEKDKGRKKDIWTPRLNLMQKVNKEYEKLLKYYSKEDAMAKIRSSYGDAVAEAFKGIEDFKVIDKWGGFDAEATIENLRKLAEKTAPEYKKKFLEAAGTLEAELEIKVKEQEIQKAKDDIQKAFDSYELTKTLDNLGLNVDFTYMVGGRPMTLEQIRKDIEDKLKTAKATKGQEKLVEAYEDYLRKVDDMEHKAAVERLKNYGKYLTRAYSDAAAVQLKYFSDLEKMQNNFARAQTDLEKKLRDPNISAGERSKIERQLQNLPAQAKRAGEGMRVEMEKELSKLNMDALFKDSMFSEMFQDLGNLTDRTLDQMLAKIKEIQDGANNLTLSQVRQLAQAAEKIRTAKIDTASFKDALGYVQKAYELRRKGISPRKASDDLADESLKLDLLEKQVESVNLILGIKEKSYKIDNDAVIVGNERYALTDKEKLLLDKNVDALNNELNSLKQSRDKQREKVADAQELGNTYKRASQALNRMAQYAQEWADVAVNGINAITAAVEMFGGEISDSERIWLDFISSAITSCLALAQQMVALEIAINSTAGALGVIATALSVAASLFQAILGSHDAKKEKQIERLKDRVHGLQKAYEDLGRAIGRAYEVNDYRAGVNKTLANIRAQEQAYREMIRLEKAKKKTDKNAIREAEDALSDLARQREDLMESMYEDWGSVGKAGIKGEAESFVDAWLKAYKETGDGLSGLQEHWDEFFQNLVLKQAASAVVSKRLQKYIDQINSVIEGGGSEINMSAIFAEIGKNLKVEMKEWDSELQSFLDSLGISGGELQLSELQQGIQNITEPQAAAIEAYLNSMRFAVFEQNNILTQMLTAIQAQYGTSTDNPILSEVKAIRSLVASIDSNLKKVIKPAGSRGYIMQVG